MKNFLRGGRGMFFRLKQKACRTLPKALLIILCVLFSNLSVSPAFGQEAEGLKNIVPLKIGDRIPDKLWDMPLKVVNHPEGKKTIKLSDYADKNLIILDFWSSWCGSCINKMPESSQLKKEYSDKIQIIYSSSERENKINGIVENVEGNAWLDYVFEDSIFNRVFPHKLVPHVVWIDNTGLVLAISGGQALSRANIQGYFDTGKMNIEIKQDILDFNRNLSFSENLEKLNIEPLQGYVSNISSAIAGIGSYSGTDKTVITHMNSDILSLYRTALRLGALHKSISIDTASTLYQITKEGKALYCYELTAKAAVSVNKLKEIMLTDLNHFFNCQVEFKAINNSPHYVLKDRDGKELSNAHQ